MEDRKICIGDEVYILGDTSLLGNYSQNCFVCSCYVKSISCGLLSSDEYNIMHSPSKTSPVVYTVTLTNGKYFCFSGHAFDNGPFLDNIISVCYDGIHNEKIITYDKKEYLKSVAPILKEEIEKMQKKYDCILKEIGNE